MSAIRVTGSTPRHIARRLVLAMEQEGDYSLVSSTPGALSFERRRSGFLGAGERVERITLRISTETGGHAITIDGPIEPERRVAVEAAASGDSIADAVLEAQKGTFAVFPDVFADAVATAEAQPRLRHLPPKRKPTMAAPPPRPEPLAAIHLVLTGGRVLEIPSLVTIGRNPDPVPGSGRHALGDDDMSVSKTHATFEPVVGGVTVTDLGSSNGTSVLTGGVFIDLVPHSPQLLAIGTLMRLGDLELTIRGA